MTTANDTLPPPETVPAPAEQPAAPATATPGEAASAAVQQQQAELPLQTPAQAKGPAQLAATVVQAVKSVVAPDALIINGKPQTTNEIAQRQQRDRSAFGEDLWGISNDQRAAALNAEKLQRLGLPVLGSEQDLADLLGITLGRLRWFTYDKAADTTWHYVRYTIPKRSGGERVILAPKAELKALQRKVLSEIVGKAPVALAAHGFVPGKSTVTNARQHVGKQVIVKLDLKDFFPSITFARVRGMLIALGYPFAVAAALALLCTEYDREEFERNGKRYFISVGPRHLVQGAPTSPTLANLVAWNLDRRLMGLAKARGFSYTRYADDLVFSGDDPEAARKLRVLAERIIRDEHFAVNRSKTKISRQSARQIVTGMVVNQQVGTPRTLRRQLRAILHNAEKEGLAAQNRDQRKDFGAYLQGMIAYVNAGNPKHAAKLKADLAKIQGK